MIPENRDDFQVGCGVLMGFFAFVMAVFAVHFAEYFYYHWRQ